MSTTKTWKDETGLEIPTSRISPLEKKMERNATKIVKEAKKVNNYLIALKKLIEAYSNEVYTDFLKENSLKAVDRKGNFTWYNFDRSIKIEININDIIQFDDMLIQGCKEKLDEFLESSITGVESFIKDLILDAFETSRGKLDTRKVMALLKHKSKIKDKRYHEAMDLLERSIRRPDSKRYSRVWERDEEGKYQSIDLNFSSVEA